MSHELIWTRRLTDLLGCANSSIAAVMAVFFLGMAAGSITAAQAGMTRGGRQVWQLLAAAQAGTALFSLVPLHVTSFSDWLWPALGPARLLLPVGPLVKWGVAVLCLAPPSFSAGMALPLLAQAGLGQESPMSRWGSWLYLVNTAGGILGVAVLAFWLLPVAGVQTGGWIVSALNLGVAGACWLRVRALPVTTLDSCAAQAPRRSEQVPAGLLLLTFAGGALFMGSEITVLHQLNQLLLSSVHSTAFVLLLVLLAIALGTALAGLIRNRRPMVPVVLWICALACAVEPFAVVSSSHGLRPIPIGEGLLAYGGVIAGTVFPAVLPLFVVCGMLFPILFSLVAADQNDVAGRRWGHLLFLNGLGAVAGTMATQFLLLPVAGLWRTMAVLALGYVGLALFGPGSCRPSWRSWAARLAMLPAASAVLLLYGPLPVFSAGKAGAGALATETGPEGVAVVTRDARGRIDLLLNNSYIIGGTAAPELARQQMLLPLFLHPRPSVVAVVGMGTGVSADAVLAEPAVERLESIEISPLVAQMARRHFSPYHRYLFSDPRSQIVTEDGRTYLAACRDRFDVVIGDLFIPWRSGDGRLVSREYFRTVCGALRPGGLFCQWLPLYQLTEAQTAGIIATFLSVFPDAQMIRNGHLYRQPCLGLVGFRSGAGLSWDVLVRRSRDARTAGENRIGSAFLRHPDGLAMFLLGPARVPAATRTRVLNTLDNAWLEFTASRERLAPDWQAFTEERWSAFNRQCTQEVTLRYALPEEMHAGVFCSQLWLEAQGATATGQPEERIRDTTLMAINRLPVEVGTDPVFDWRQLLMDVQLRLYGQRSSRFTPL